MCSSYLPHLHTLDVAWNTENFVFDQLAQELQVSLNCPDSDSETDSEYNHDSDDEFECCHDRTHAPTDPLRNAESPSERQTRRWQRWRAIYHSSTKGVMANFMQRCPSMQIINWHLRFAVDQEKPPRWMWRRSHPQGPWPTERQRIFVPDSSEWKFAQGEKEENREVGLVDDLTFEEGVREPDACFSSVGREAEYLTLHHSRR